MMAHFVKNFAEVKIYYVYSIPSVYLGGDLIKKQDQISLAGFVLDKSVLPSHYYCIVF